MKHPSPGDQGKSPSELITKTISELDDWRGETVGRIRAIVEARRAIDAQEGEKLDATALNALVRAAVALNVSGKKSAPPKRAKNG
jgi:hypothetical protein